jgi:hypothetical protein
VRALRSAPSASICVINDEIGRAWKGDCPKLQDRAVVISALALGLFPLLSPAPGSAFSIVSEQAMRLSGITFGMNNAVTLRKHQLERMPADVAVCDYNNDGVTDICLVDGADLPSQDKFQQSEPVRGARQALVGTGSALKPWVARPLDLSMINLVVARAALAAGLKKRFAACDDFAQMRTCTLVQLPPI